MGWLNGYRMRLVLIGLVAGIVFGIGQARADFTFGEPTNLGPTVNTEYYEDNPCISVDGLELYFNSNRPNGHGRADLYVLKRATTSDPWQAPINLGATVNSSETDAGPCISTDELSLFFTSNRPGGSGGMDIWVTTRTTKSDHWGPPVNLGTTVNGPDWDHFPSISTDGLELFFTSGPGSTGNMDLWVTRRATTGDEWSNPVNLGAGVNSSVWDFDPSISPSGLELFFRSDRSPGGYLSGDIYVVRRQSVSDPWGPPLYVGPADNRPVAQRGEGSCGLAFSPDGSTLYFSPDDRPGGFGRYDLWQAPVIAIVDFNGDGIVDSADMCVMIDHWGTDNSLCDIGPMPWGDGIVDVEDLKVLAKHLFDDCNALAHWKLDEKEGKIAHDYVGGYNATLHGESLWQPTGGQVVGALELDGIDDYISTDFILNPYWGAFSVFAWIKGGGPGQVIITQLTGTGNIWLGIDAQNGALMTELQPPSTGWVTTNKPLVSESIITDEQWHHVGFVWDGSYRILYVDSIEVAKDTTAQNPLKPSDGGLYIGTGKGMESGSFFSGLIDDVRIYNRVVSP
jgi:hypothetical protein